MRINRGQIWLAKLAEIKNDTSIQQGIRPVIIISNNKCNKHSPVITIIPLTTKIKNNLPTHVKIPTYLGIDKKSMAITEQVMPLDIKNLIKLQGKCSNDIMNQINNALLIQLGINTKYKKLKETVA